MNLQSLSIKNFGAFKGEQVFKFPQAPGLYFMQGKNLVDRRLGGNGAGKSTVWKAFEWLVEGKTSDGLKAGDICNWEVPKGVEVELHYSHSEGNDYYTRRTWGPISWTHQLVEDQVIAWPPEDLAKAESNLFLADLGVSGMAMQHCIFMAQDAPMFFDLKGEAQASLFGSVLGLDHWLDYSAKASKKAQAADQLCRELEAKVARLSGRLEDHVDYRPKILEYEAKRQDDRARLGTDFDVISADLSKNKRLYEKAKKEGEECEGRLRRLKGKRDDAQAAKQKAGEELVKLAQRRDQLRDKAADELEYIKQLDQGTCNSCGLEIKSHPDYDRAINRAHDRAKELKGDADRLDQLVLDAAQGVRQLQSDLNDVEDAHQVALDFAQKAESELRSLNVEASGMNRQLDDIEADLDKLARAKNPYKELQAEAQERARTAQAEFLEARRALDSANEKYSLYSMWVRSFKEIRLQEISEAITELEIEVNSSVAELGLDGWEIKMDVDRETKGGSIQRGFSITVRGPSNDRHVPWASWSGGEKQRLRLAGQMGFSNLIRSRLGVELALESWDEPFKGLSREGKRDTLACLERRARVEGRQIWIVDHESHDFGGFSGEALIIKDQDGSRIEQS